MKKNFSRIFLLIFVVICFFASSAFGQDKDESADFTGTWRLVRKTSHRNGKTVDELIKETFILDTTFDKPDFKVLFGTAESKKDRSSADVIIHTDGREEKRKFRAYISIAPIGGQIPTDYEAEFISDLKKRTIISTGKTGFFLKNAPGMARQQVVIVEKWEVSKDGSELIRSIKQTVNAELRDMINGMGNTGNVGTAGTEIELKFFYRRTRSETGN